MASELILSLVSLPSISSLGRSLYNSAIQQSQCNPVHKLSVLVYIRLAILHSRYLSDLIVSNHPSDALAVIAITSGKGPIRRGSCKSAGRRQLQLRLQIDSPSFNPLNGKVSAFCKHPADRGYPSSGTTLHFHLIDYEVHCSLPTSARYYQYAQQSLDGHTNDPHNLYVSTTSIYPVTCDWAVAHEDSHTRRHIRRSNLVCALHATMYGGIEHPLACKRSIK